VALDFPQHETAMAAAFAEELDVELTGRGH